MTGWRRPGRRSATTRRCPSCLPCRSRRGATDDVAWKQSEQKLSSNLRPTTREYVHFRSRNKDGVHTIRSAVAENPVLHANLTSLSSIGPELLTIVVFIAEIGNFALFCRCDVDLDQMTLICKLGTYPLKMYPQTQNELSMSRLRKLS